jgi:hypothetical protein
MNENLKFNLIENETAYEVSASQDISGEVVIPDLYEGGPVKRIAKWGFRDCKNLTNIKIPDSVESIGEGAFQSSGIWNNEKEMVYAAGKWLGILYADKWLIKAITGDRPKVKEDLILKDGTTGIADNGINGSYSSIIIPTSLKYIGKDVFYHCPQGGLNDFEKIIVKEGNKIYKTDGNNLIRISDNTLIFGLDGIIPDYIKKIGEAAFDLNLDLKSVIIPDGVTHIEDEAFCACRNLKKIIIPDSVTHIGKDAFFNCRSLPEIIIPGTVKTIGHWAFYRTGEKYENFNIYVKGHTEKPEGWDNDWNPDNQPVHYNWNGNI